MQGPFSLRCCDAVLVVSASLAFCRCLFSALLLTGWDVVLVFLWGDSVVGRTSCVDVALVLWISNVHIRNLVSTHMRAIRI